MDLLGIFKMYPSLRNSPTVILGDAPEHLKRPTEKALLKAIISTKFRNSHHLLKEDCFTILKACDCINVATFAKKTSSHALRAFSRHFLDPPGSKAICHAPQSIS